MTNVAEVTAVVTDRCGAFLAQAHTLTGDPSKPSIAQAIAWAIRAMGGTTALLTGVTDAEVTTVTGAQVDALLDLAELKTLESIQTNLTAVNVTAGPVRQEYNDLSARLASIVKDKRTQIDARHRQWLSEPLTSSAPKQASVRAV